MFARSWFVTRGYATRNRRLALVDIVLSTAAQEARCRPQVHSVQHCCAIGLHDAECLQERLRVDAIGARLAATTQRRHQHLQPTQEAKGRHHGRRHRADAASSRSRHWQGPRDRHLQATRSHTRIAITTRSFASRLSAHVADKLFGRRIVCNTEHSQGTGSGSQHVRLDTIDELECRHTQCQQLQHDHFFELLPLASRLDVACFEPCTDAIHVRIPTRLSVAPSLAVGHVAAAASRCIHVSLTGTTTASRARRRLELSRSNRHHRCPDSGHALAAATACVIASLERQRRALVPTSRDARQWWPVGSANRQGASWCSFVARQLCARSIRGHWRSHEE